MVDLSVKSSKKKKRKLTSSAEKERHSKAHRVDDSGKEKRPEEVGEGESLNQKELDPTIEFGRPWRNLHLILSIQNKQMDLRRKVELAFNYVNLRAKEGSNDRNEDYETVKASRLIVFLNDWVQSLLISTDKKIRVYREKPQSGVIQAYLDYRCWVIFKFCLEESLRLQVSLSFSRNLLRVISCIAKNVLSLLSDMSLHSNESFFIGEGFELYTLVLDCASLVFLSHGGLSNENMDLWVSTVQAILELVHKIYDQNLESGSAGIFALRLSYLVLEPFAKFLRVHPTRKNGFRDFVDKLFELLLHLLGVLHLHFDGSNPGLAGNLLIVIEEVLLQGLFHQSHIDGFLSLRCTEKYSSSNDGKMEGAKTVIRSYHRHLFDKLETIIAAKKESALSSLGKLFHLLVDRVKKHKGGPVLSEYTRMIGRNGGSVLSGSASPKNNFSQSELNAEKRKSIFEFFVQIMEPLLLEMNDHLQNKLETGPLLDVFRILKTVNNLLASFLLEKVYIKTEDISEGACFNFLKKAYDTILSFATNLLCLPKHDINNQTKDILTLLSRELLVAVGHFLDIEYEVIENDLTSLWIMILSYLTVGHSFIDVPSQCSLISQTIGLGCQLVRLYGELRQVKNTIFALCKAIRLVMVCDNDVELNNGNLWFHTASLRYKTYAKSVGMLLHTSEFKVAIHNGIKSIPEGQASECVQQLSMDLSESMEWMKSSCSMADGKESGESNAQCCIWFGLQVELLGRGLSEMYSLVLDSLTVTVGNSSLVGRSIKDLMAIIRPCMSVLVGLHPDSINEFLSSVIGRNSCMRLTGNRNDKLKFGASAHWVFLFFFRLHMSCRSLYRQAISLMPPDISRKISEVIGDSFAAYSGGDWMERTDWTDEGCFSWIAHPSASLLDIIHSVSDLCLQNSVIDYCPLIYTWHAMALQRIVDLNRQINALEYILQRNNGIVHIKLLDDAVLSPCRKRSKMWGRCISVMKQEAAGLTEFMMNYLTLLGNDQLSGYDSEIAKSLDGDRTLHQTGNQVLGFSSVNKESLPTAIWWILCQNIDIWSIHASKKKLKLFLSHVICTSLPFISRSFAEVQKHNTVEASHLNKITVHQISAELLNDSLLYEYKFVRRHLASTFCRLLGKAVLPFFSEFSVRDVNLNSSPNWQEVLSALENSSMVVSSCEHVAYDRFAEVKLTSCLSFEVPADISRESTGMKFTACQNLLHLLCWMPKGYMNSRSFSLYVTYVLNLERLVIGSLLQRQDSLSSHKQCELLRLLVSCRRALKCIIMAYCDERTGATQYSLIPILSHDSFSVLWLSKSVSAVAGLQETLPEEWTDEVRGMIISLMDHTSYVFLTISQYLWSYAVHSIIAEKPHKEQPSSNVAQEQNSLTEFDPFLDSSTDFEAWKSVLLIAESLKKQTQGFLVSLKDILCKVKSQDVVNVVNLSKFSTVLSCISGFLWGIASALDYTNATDSYNVKLLRWKGEPVSKINLCINVFTDIISVLLHTLFIGIDQPGNLYDSGGLGLGEFSLEDFSEAEFLHGEQHQKAGTATTSLAASDMGNDISSCSVHWHSSKLEDANSVASVLNKMDSYKHQSLNNSLLQSLIKGEHPQAAILIRQLFMASSAILRLNLQTECTPMLSRLVASSIDISQILLLELADMVDVPRPFSLIWLDGVLKYLQELGSHFPLTNPTLTRSVYAKLVELHFKALGKCISLQGKEATLASHKTESSTKILHSHIGCAEASLSHMQYCLDEFKARLRMSFKVLIRKPSELHLFSAIQAIERALVGVHEGCTIIYDIKTGNADGGKVSSIVAAGIECLDLALECVSGRKRLNVVKRHIQSLIAALFNIILHLQSPTIFISAVSKDDNGPDPGAVILMCVEVLTRVSGKHALFQMDSWHVSQSLHTPAVLFQDFSRRRFSEGPVLSDSFSVLDNPDENSVVAINSYAVDRKFSIELFAACCRLLSTIVKHRKSEAERCIAVLQESAGVLLRCFEMVDTDILIRKGDFSWGVQEGVKCAFSFRRIYEELRQQKDVFGQYCSKFLSNYIWVYSGFGPLKTGIRREIDEALKPGVYALIDACSAVDLQHLHSVFGEGPCRNTLETLQHDYKQHFRYEGKV